MTDNATSPVPGPDPSQHSDASQALDRYFTACYDEVRAIAHRALVKERPGHTLETTDIVHEVFARLKKSKSLQLNDRVHFIAIAARTVRRYLYDYAKEKAAQKRGGHLQRVTLVTDADLGYEPFQPDIIALGMAMDELQRLHPRQAWVIDMRFIGGLTVDEVATRLGVSEKTVKDDTRVAYAFLKLEISRHPRQ